MDGDHVGLHLADHTARYELCYGVLGHWHHGDRLVGRQPEGAVVPAGVITDIVEVAEQEGHRVEPVDTGARHA